MAAKPGAVVFNISIAEAAQTDLDDILDRTTHAFGAVGRKRYEALKDHPLFAGLQYSEDARTIRSFSLSQAIYFTFRNDCTPICEATTP